MNQNSTFPYWPTQYPGLAASIAGRQQTLKVQDLAINLIPEFDDQQIETTARAGAVVPPPDSRGYNPSYGQRPGSLYAYLAETMTPPAAAVAAAEKGNG